MQEARCEGSMTWSVAKGADEDLIRHSVFSPFLFLHHHTSFQQRSGNVRALSKALFVSIAPRVALHQFEDWDAYIMSDDNYWM